MFGNVGMIWQYSKFHETFKIPLKTLRIAAHNVNLAGMRHSPFSNLTKFHVPWSYILFFLILSLPFLPYPLTISYPCQQTHFIYFDLDPTNSSAGFFFFLLLRDKIQLLHILT